MSILLAPMILLAPTIRSSSLALAVCAALAPSLHAAETDPSPLAARVIDLDVVVVTAALPVSPLTFELSTRVPRQPVPASDGADYLKTIPGFATVRNGGTNGDPVLRGMFGSRLNLLTNDGAMPGACPSRMDNAMSYIAPETYDSLVVVKGPQTVLWGPGASAGTVRFERDREVFESPALKLAGSVLAGSFDRNDQVLDATYGDRLGYARVSANRSESGDYRDGGGQTVGSAWKKWNADAALGWTPGPDSLLELSAGTGDGQARYATRGMDGTRFDRRNLGARAQWRNLGDRLTQLEASVFHNRADHVMDNYTLRSPNPGGAMPMPMASNVERLTSGGRVAGTWGGPSHELVTGVDLQDSRHRRRSATGRGAYQARPWAVDARFANVGAFAEGTWFAGDRNRLVAGARADRAEATDVRASIAATGMGPGMGMPMPNPTAGRTRRETLAAGFIRLEQDAAEMPMTWYAGLGHTERMPDYWELFSPDRGPAGAVNAFAGAQTEKTTQLDIGVQYRGKRVDAWVSAYAGRIDDYLLFDYAPGGGMMGPRTRVDNVDARIGGAELGVEYRPAAQWKVGGTLAYARGDNLDAGRPLPQMPPLETRLNTAWEDGRWSAGALVRLVAAQDRVAPGQGSVVGRDLGPSGAFATLAVNGGVRLHPSLQLTAGVDNVFDRRYSEHLNLAGNADFGYPADPVRINEPGRTAWVKLNLTY